MTTRPRSSAKPPPRRTATGPSYRSQAPWRPWITVLIFSLPAFALPERTAELIRADLAAGIPHETDSGVVDFHALCHTFGSMVVR